MSLPQKLCRSAAACQCFVLTLCKGAICNPYMNHIYIYVCLRVTQRKGMRMRFSRRRVCLVFGLVVICLVG